VNRFSILVVDDTEANRVMLRKVLRLSGYEVLEATSGREALDLLHSGVSYPDLIVSDVEMPGMDGITLTRQIRLEEDPELARIPLIVASGNADRAMRDTAIEAGADIFLTKPFELQDLRREIASQLRSRRKIASRLSPSRHAEANRFETPAEKVG